METRGEQGGTGAKDEWGELLDCCIVPQTRVKFVTSAFDCNVLTFCIRSNYVGCSQKSQTDRVLVQLLIMCESL